MKKVISLGLLIGGVFATYRLYKYIYVTTMVSSVLWWFSTFHPELLVNTSLQSVSFLEVLSGSILTVWVISGITQLARVYWKFSLILGVVGSSLAIVTSLGSHHNVPIVAAFLGIVCIVIIINTTVGDRNSKECSKARLQR